MKRHQSKLPYLLICVLQSAFIALIFVIYYFFHPSSQDLTWSFNSYDTLLQQPAPSKTEWKWQSNVTQRGDVFIFDNVCIRGKRILLINFTWDAFETHIIDWMQFFDGDEAQRQLSQSTNTIFIQDRILFIPGISTGLYSNPTHMFFNHLNQLAGALMYGYIEPYDKITWMRNNLVPRTNEERDQAWDVTMAKRLGLLKKGYQIILYPDNAMKCFKEITIPSRKSNDLKSYRRSHDKAYFPSDVKECELLLYDRGETTKRIWTNAYLFYEMIQTRIPNLKIRYFNESNSFSALNVPEQLQIISRSQIYVGPHGGVEGALSLMRRGSMLLVLNCEHYSSQWLFGMAKAMRYSGGVRVMKDCQQPVSLHSSFNADPAPLVDEVEHYVKTNCEFDEGEPSKVLVQVGDGYRCDLGKWLMEYPENPHRCRELILQNPDCSNDFFSFSHDDNNCFCVHPEIDCIKNLTQHRSVSTWRTKFIPTNGKIASIRSYFCYLGAFEASGSSNTIEGCSSEVCISMESCEELCLNQLGCEGFSWCSQSDGCDGMRCHLLSSLNPKAEKTSRKWHTVWRKHTSKRHPCLDDSKLNIIDTIELNPLLG